MKDLTPLYESIHGRLAEQLSTMRHVQDDELYAMIDAEIRDAAAPLAAAPFAAAGVLISGGHDVGPTNYGAFPKPYCGMVVAMRDTQDLAVTKWALENGKPLFGICRGIQILNVAAGGTLYQDLEIEGGFEHHHDGEKHPRNTPWHPVSFGEGSPLKDIYGKDQVLVNSYHHQAVREPGRNVTVIATSCDGVTEAIKVDAKAFTMAVQWHPEMMFDSEEQLKVIKAFVDACR